MVLRPATFSHSQRPPLSCLTPPPPPPPTPFAQRGRDGPDKTPASIAVAFISGSFALSIAGLVAFHTRMLICNLTTNEDLRAKFEGNPFSRGCWPNIFFTLCGPLPPSLLRAREPAVDNQPVNRRLKDAIVHAPPTPEATQRQVVPQIVPQVVPQVVPQAATASVESAAPAAGEGSSPQEPHSRPPPQGQGQEQASEEEHQPSAAGAPAVQVADDGDAAEAPARRLSFSDTL